MKDRGLYEYPKDSNIWWIRYRDRGGKLHREKCGPKSLARAAYAQRRLQIREGKFFPELAARRKEVSFDEIIQDALEYSRTRHRPGSYRAARWHAPILRGWFGGRAAASVTPQEIECKLNKLAENGKKPATVNRYRAQLSAAYSLAIRNGKLGVNPARAVKLRRENNARVSFLDDEEERALRMKVRELYPEREPELDLALHTGLRRGEQYGLRWEQLNLRLGMITIPRAKHGEKRYVQVNSAARQALDRLAERPDSSGYVCRRDYGRWFEKCVRAARFADLRWHDLRHTFASRLIMAGADLRSVQELMGHKTIQMTVRYAHLAPTHLRDVVERLVDRAPTESITRSITSSCPPPRQREEKTTLVQ